MIRRMLVLFTIPFVIFGCNDGEGEEAAKKGTKQAAQEAEFTAKIQEQTRKTIGYPEINDSLELRNLKNRYELLDDPNKTGYVYLIDRGLIFAEYTIKGKVSSLNSQFTNPSQVVKADFGDGWEAPVVDQAEADGSYGANPDGIFFWTADNVYVEWAGVYLYSEERLEIQQPEQNVITKEVE